MKALYKVVIFDLDEHEDFNVGQLMIIKSVNRQTGVMEVDQDFPKEVWDALTYYYKKLKHE